MKVFFDTNVYVAEALLGAGAKRMIDATARAKWRMHASRFLLEELTKVLVDDLSLSPRLANLAKQRIVRRCAIVEGASRARVPRDPNDSPILQAALECSADYLVSNDRHLLELDPFEGLRIISMDRFYELLQTEGLLK